MIKKAISFGFWWDNLEAIVEWLEAIPDKETLFATIDTQQLKEAVIKTFEEVFSETPLTQQALVHSGLGIFIYGLSAICMPCSHPFQDALHQPIIRRIRLHPDSDPTINNISVTIAATLRERVGILRKFDLEEVRKKYAA
jgi:hypothetical protein